jgi:hypothetical protein
MGHAFSFLSHPSLVIQELDFVDAEDNNPDERNLSRSSAAACTESKKGETRCAAEIAGWQMHEI